MKIGEIILVLLFFTSAYCEACVTVNTETGTYTVDKSGCIK